MSLQLVTSAIDVDQLWSIDLEGPASHDLIAGEVPDGPPPGVRERVRKEFDMQHPSGYRALTLVLVALVLPGCYGKQTLRQPITVNEIADDVAAMRRTQTTISDDLDVLEVKLEEQADVIRQLRTENQYLYQELGAKLEAIDVKIQDAIGRNTGFTDSGAYWSDRTDDKSDSDRPAEASWAGSDPDPESDRASGSRFDADLGSSTLPREPEESVGDLGDGNEGMEISPGDRERATGQQPDPGSTEGRAKRVYDQAYLDLTRGNYSLAILGFKEFVRRVPDSEMADNAQYWVGESYYAQGDFRQAVREFSRVIDNYSNGDKIPGALLKTGFSKLQLGDRDEAISYLLQVSDDYPDTEESRLAQDKLRSIR